MTGGEVILGRAEDLIPRMGSRSVDLTVTSPPYWNAIDYGVHVKHGWSEDHRSREVSQSYEGYVQWLAEVIGETWAATKPGGFCVLVLGTILNEGRTYPIPHDLWSELRLRYRGFWDWHHHITWHKVTGGVRRAGNFIRHRRAGYYHPNIMTETILVLRRPGPPIRDRSMPRLEAGWVFTREIANDVWHIPPVPPKHLDHPCPFPEEIPYRLISLYSNPGDLVFDPFAGVGTTLKVAARLGRRYLGVEMEPKYAEAARERVSEDLRLRPHQLIARFDRAVGGGGLDPEPEED